MTNAPDHDAGTGLHELARHKVRRAMAALARPADVVPDAESDDLVQQALERLRQHVHSFAAVDHTGQPISEEHLVRVVIGPLAERSRDADTAAALLATITGEEPPQLSAADVRPAPPTLILDALLSDSGYRYAPSPAPQPTGWPADPPAREPRIVPPETSRA